MTNHNRTSTTRPSPKPNLRDADAKAATKNEGQSKTRGRGGYYSGFLVSIIGMTGVAFLPMYTVSSTLYLSTNNTPDIAIDLDKPIIIKNDSTAAPSGSDTQLSNAEYPSTLRKKNVTKAVIQAEPESESEVEPAYAIKDSDCPFRHSPLYRKIYVYPDHGDITAGWGSTSIMSSAAQKNSSSIPKWPWIDIDLSARNASEAHYDRTSPGQQYSTEHMIRELMINPKSCLRSYDPETADLFYVPYMVSTEHHLGRTRVNPDFQLSRYGKAIRDIVEKGDHTAWESTWGLTDKYWKRKDGADHILVFSEPLHGLWHPRNQRGSFHFLHSQYQTKPPIVISVELSKTFVQQYGPCATKNILVPYPNVDGQWYNGKYQKQALEKLREANIAQASTSPAATTAERNLADIGRPLAQFYSGGNHGTCTALRRAMQEDYKCSPSHKLLKTIGTNYPIAMRTATFCPCPGGDSPSAKRMYDVVLAGCIPVILSEDFVWPLTKEFDPASALDSADFSIRLPASNYSTRLLDGKTCKPKEQGEDKQQAPQEIQGPVDLESLLQTIPAEQIAKLRKGVEKAASLYAWYEVDSALPDNPIREGVLPTGGLAKAVVSALADRTGGKMWPACYEHLKGMGSNVKDATSFKC